MMKLSFSRCFNLKCSYYKALIISSGQRWVTSPDICFHISPQCTQCSARVLPAARLRRTTGPCAACGSA